LRSTSSLVPLPTEPRRRWRPSGVMVAGGLAGLLAALAGAVSWRDPLPGETWLLETVGAVDGGWRTAASAVARATDLLPVVAVTGLVVVGLGLRGRVRVAVLLAVACATVWLVNPLLKTLVARPRPALVDLPERLSAHAFPSGHAANSAVVVGAVVLLVVGSGRRRSAAVVGAAVLVVVAAAQLTLARHYPSDIVAGWLLAAAVLALLPRVTADPVRRARSRRTTPS
jgi:membrane-associated phospholipid phosphatase